MKRVNDRGYFETCFVGKHVSVPDLRENDSIVNRYLEKNNIPPFPESVEFHISQVSHVTGLEGLRGILNDGGFRPSSSRDLLWWDLSISRDDIRSAEGRFIRSKFPQRSRAQARAQGPFLAEFTTSPAFQSVSRYGNFRFTLPLTELLRLYGEQFCGGSAPVLRVYETGLYRREIVYSVLVHAPHHRQYDHYPRLPRGVGDGRSVCAFADGAVVWRCQAPSDSYGLSLVVNALDQHVCVSERAGREEYYVWDHVSLVFHVDPGQALHVGPNQLRQSVSACTLTEPSLLRDSEGPLDLSQARQILGGLIGTHDY